MKLSDLNDLFLHELKDIYDAEHQLLKALPRMARAASSTELQQAFEDHLAQTEQHVERLESVFEACGEEPERETCAGMKGLVAEGERLLKENAEPDVLDAGLIAAAQRVEHYEIAAYGTLIAWAGTAGIDGATELQIQWTQSTDDFDAQANIRYDVYVNGVIADIRFGSGGPIIAYGQPGQNTIQVVASDTAGNASTPATITIFL